MKQDEKLLQELALYILVLNIDSNESIVIIWFLHK